MPGAAAMSDAVVVCFDYSHKMPSPPRDYRRANRARYRKTSWGEWAARMDWAHDTGVITRQEWIYLQKRQKFMIRYSAVTS